MSVIKKVVKDFTKDYKLLVENILNSTLSTVPDS